jgi:hypothetical protein
VDIGLLGGVGEAAKADGAAHRLRDAVGFLSGLWQRGIRVGWRRWGKDSADLDGFAAVGAVGGFQRFGLVGEPLPIEGGSPWQRENLASEDAGGMDGLAKLPVGQMGGAAQGVEVGGGGVCGAVAMGLDPSLGPADVIVAGGGPDGEGFKALEEVQPCRSRGGTIGRVCRWLEHGDKKTVRMNITRKKSRNSEKSVAVGGRAINPVGQNAVARPQGPDF